jgi:GH24 family phage-related lysozyme (muramidase)
MTTAAPRKSLFDAIRTIAGRSLRQSEVDRLDHSIDAVACQSSPAEIDTARRAPLTVSAQGLNLIRTFEGCARVRGDGMVEAYADPGTGGEPWTIGWGATGAGIGPGTLWSRKQCDARLESDLVRYAAEVSEALDGAPTTQAQFDALVSFHYNTGAIARATLTRLHRAGDYAGAAREFARWNRAGGRVMRGLSRRRAAEARLYRR